MKFITHSTTIDNELGIATGWLEGKLSKTGELQAKRLMDLVEIDSIDIIFCSDLSRAVNSAKLAFGNFLEIVEDHRLRECNYGDFNGKASNLFKDNMISFINDSYPNGESYKDVENRMSDFIRFLKKNYEDTRIGIIGHQATQLSLEVLVKKKTWQEAIKSDWRNEGKWKPFWEYEIGTSFS